MNMDIGVGNLWGNQFGLIIRLIDPNDFQHIEERIKSLKKKGMINYFGMQRFGSCATKTYMIGLKLVKRQWKEIV
jgi:tRNA pseudouridine13 synthase